MPRMRFVDVVASGSADASQEAEGNEWVDLTNLDLNYYDSGGEIVSVG